MAAKRIAWLDFAKGVTIFLVVIVHVVEGVYKTGQFPAQQNISTNIMGVLFTVVMPVFFALSGYVYTPPQNGRQYIIGIGKKLVNLGVPYVIFSVLYVCLQHGSQAVHHLNSWQDLAHIYALPIGYLWYLYVLFFVYGVVGLLTLLRLSRLIQGIIYSLFLWLAVTHTTALPYALTGVLMWTSSFYIGYVFKQRPTWLTHWLTVSLSGLLFVGGLAWQMHQGHDWFTTDMMTTTDVWAKLASVPLFLFLYQKNRGGLVSRYFTTYGRYSLIIYLVHAPMASIGRVLLLKLGINHYALLLVLLVAFAWGTSLMVIYGTRKWPLLNAVFNPVAYIRQIASPKQGLDEQLKF